MYSQETRDLPVLHKCTVKKQETYQCGTKCTMQLHHFLHNFFKIFNLLTFYFFLIFFYLIVEIESYFLQLSISIIVIALVFHQILILNEWMLYLALQLSRVATHTIIEAFSLEACNNFLFLFFWLPRRKVLWWWEMLFILKCQLPCFPYNS